MSICVSVKVAEGLVLAADSASALVQALPVPGGIAQQVMHTFEHADKVMQFKDYPIGIMCWGANSIGDRTIQSLVMEFGHGYEPKAENKNYQVKGIADGILQFIRDRYNGAFPTSLPATTPTTTPVPPTIGLFMGGYSSKQFFAEEYIAELPRDNAWIPLRPTPPGGKPLFGVGWWGMPEALTRLIKGFGTTTLNSLVAAGFEREKVQKWAESNAAQLPLAIPGMPLRDAIDLAKYAVEVTIGQVRFTLGPPLCGGDVDVAVITSDDFQWARRKRWTAENT
jgi:hypothetical protein